MKKDWQKINLEQEIVDLSFYYKGTIDIAQIQIHQTEKQQLILLAKYKLSTIIKFKIKLKLQRLIKWITRENDERVKPFDAKEELNSIDRYKSASTTKTSKKNSKTAIVNGGLDYHQRKGGGWTETLTKN